MGPWQALLEEMRKQPEECREAFIGKQESAALREFLRLCSRDDEAELVSFGGYLPTLLDDRPMVSAGVVEGAFAGRFRGVTILGRGGMGDVYRATDGEGRPVAVKLLGARFHGRADAAEQFVDEAGTLAQLDHPGVVPMYERGGVTLGGAAVPFFSMRLVSPPRRLTDDIRSAYPPGKSPDRVAVAGLLGVVQAVARTVAHAHARGVVHYDVKPENVMLGPAGEVYLMDWGIARRATDDGRRPRGTPGYAPPEVSGTSADDVYALGRVLQHILTGNRPRAGDHDVARWGQSAVGEPHNLAVDSQNPTAGSRPTAAEFAGRLRAHQDATARAEARAAASRPYLFGAIAAGFVVSLALAAGVWQYRAIADRERAARAQEEALRISEADARRQADADRQQAEAARQQADADRRLAEASRVVAEAARELPDRPQRAGLLAAEVSDHLPPGMTAAAASRVLADAYDHLGGTPLDTRDAGRVMDAAVGRTRAVVGQQRGATLLSLAGGPSRVLVRESRVPKVAVSADDRWAATAAFDGVRVWDLNADPPHPVAHYPPAKAVAETPGRPPQTLTADTALLQFTPDSARLLVRLDGRLFVVDLPASGKLPPARDLDSKIVGRVDRFALAADGRTAAHTPDPSAVVVLNLDPGAGPPRKFAAGWLGRPMFGRSARELIHLESRGDAPVRVWNLDQPEAKPRVLTHPDLTQAPRAGTTINRPAVVTADGVLIVASGRKLYLWNLSRADETTPSAVRELPVTATALALTAAGVVVVPADGAGFLLLPVADLIAGRGDWHRRYGHDGPVASFHVCTGAGSAVSVGRDGSARFWDLAESIMLAEGQDGVLLDWLPGDRLAMVSQIQAPGKPMEIRGTVYPSMTAVELGPASPAQQLLGASFDRFPVASADPAARSIDVWRPRHPTHPYLRFVLPDKLVPARPVVSSDGRWVAVVDSVVGRRPAAGDPPPANTPRSLIYWHLDGGPQAKPVVVTLPARQTAGVLAVDSRGSQVALSCDGQLVLADRFDPPNPPRLRTLGGPVTQAAFTADGRLLLTNNPQTVGNAITGRPGSSVPTVVTEKGVLVAWDVTTDIPTERVVHRFDRRAGRFLLAGTTVVASDTQTTVVWDHARPLLPVATIPHGTPMQPLALSADGRWLVLHPSGLASTLAAPRDLSLWDLKAPRGLYEEHVLTVPDGAVRHLAFDDPGRRFAVGMLAGTGSSVVHWELTADPASTRRIIPAAAGPLAFDPSGGQLAGIRNRAIEVWPLDPPTLRRLVRTSAGRPLSDEERRLFGLAKPQPVGGE